MIQPEFVNVPLMNPCTSEVTSKVSAPVCPVFTGVVAVAVDAQGSDPDDDRFQALVPEQSALALPVLLSTAQSKVAPASVQGWVIRKAPRVLPALSGIVNAASRVTCRRADETTAPAGTSAARAA